MKYSDHVVKIRTYHTYLPYVPTQVHEQNDLKNICNNFLPFPPARSIIFSFASSQLWLARRVLPKADVRHIAAPLFSTASNRENSLKSQPRANEGRKATDL